jgi:hypothetical protein
MQCNYAAREKIAIRVRYGRKIAAGPPYRIPAAERARWQRRHAALEMQQYRADR